MVSTPTGLIVINDVLLDPLAYRAACLRQSFGPVVLGHQTFHGIAHPPSSEVPAFIDRICPWFAPGLTFLRLSPFGQVEPNDLHDDAMMGAWTGIVYLNQEPDPRDGTIVQDEWIPAQFNRLLIFRAELPHKRAIFDNYGTNSETARLIQVIFGGTPSWPSQLGS